MPELAPNSAPSAAGRNGPQAYDRINIVIMNYNVLHFVAIAIAGILPGGGIVVGSQW